MTEAVIGERLQIIDKPVKTVAVIAMRDGQILTVRHRAGTTAGEGVTGFPGGRQGDQETEREAAIREFKEETGLDASADDLTEFPGNFFEADLNFNGSGKKHATMKIFIVSNFTGVLKDGASKLEEPEWLLLKRINGGLYETPPNVLEAIQNAQKFLKDRI